MNDVMKAGILGFCLASMSGCSWTDPMIAEPGRWTPNGANDANLAAEVANPADLIQGRGVTGADGQMAAAAVQRLRKGQVKALPDSDLADIKVSGSGGPASTAVDSQGSP